MSNVPTPTEATEPVRIRLPVKDERVNDLLLWRDVKKSAAVLVAALAIFLTIKYAKFTFIGALAYILIAVILAFNIYAFVSKAAHRNPLPLPAAVKYGVTEEQTKSLAERSTPCLNKALSGINTLLSGAAPGLAAGVVAALYVAARLSNVVSIASVLFFLIIVAFTVPKIYELRKEKIDAHLETVRARGTEFYDKHLHSIAQRIPRARTAEGIVPEGVAEAVSTEAKKLS